MIQTLSRVALLAVWSSLPLVSMVSVESSQQPARTSPGKSERAGRQQPDGSGVGSMVTVTGCVDDGGEAGHYMLTSARVSGDTPKSRTAASADKGTLGSTYTLIGGDLQTHVGHKVEVTGTMDSTMKKGAKDVKAPSRKKKSSDDNIAAATARATNGTLTVKSVKMVASACP